MFTLLATTLAASDQAYPGEDGFPQNSGGKIFAGFEGLRCNTGQMKEPSFKSDDDKLIGLLRESRAAPTLPPRFQENVWRRIETAERRDAPAAEGNWLDAVAGWLLRPRLAFAVAVALVLAGLGFGWNSGEHLARQDAQARYVAAVAPNSLR